MGTTAVLTVLNILAPSETRGFVLLSPTIQEIATAAEITPIVAVQIGATSELAIERTKNRPNQRQQVPPYLQRP